MDVEVDDNSSFCTLSQGMENIGFTDFLPDISLIHPRKMDNNPKGFGSS